MRCCCYSPLLQRRISLDTANDEIKKACHPHLGQVDKTFQYTEVQFEFRISPNPTARAPTTEVHNTKFDSRVPLTLRFLPKTQWNHFNEASKGRVIAGHVTVIYGGKSNRLFSQSPWQRTDIGQPQQQLFTVNMEL
ncbi:hypothetical protein CEXT_16331 [Caerostris extrusa]|uniref:Uncharacterized protein n=1 Tax=Caerostris extrusa TaxID=172846 RepID=A0AAV4MA02_CAEEX|nr:hypothetical protein CEXT_16331 [Caerostris extrusa]